MLGTVTLKRGLTVDDLTESFSIASLVLDLHSDELGPTDGSVFVEIILGEHFFAVVVSDLSVSKINHDLLELALVHLTIMVLVVVLEGSNNCGLLLWVEGLLVLEGELVVE